MAQSSKKSAKYERQKELGRERQRRYRAKLSEEKREEKRKYDRERTAKLRLEKKIKKISDMTGREKRKMRKYWRERNKIRKQKKEAHTEEEVVATPKTTEHQIQEEKLRKSSSSWTSGKKKVRKEKPKVYRTVKKQQKKITDLKKMLERRKLVCTTQYIYKALFVDGRNHDIVVDALGKEWRLHKLYLTQSPYFQSMFSGSWKETNNKYIKIEVADPTISVDSLRVVLGSLYQDEVTIEPADVVGVLAAATLFQLDGLIDQCLGIMVESISPLTAISYYEAASQYGLQRIKQATVKWFRVNLMTYYPTHTKRLRQIEPDLMSLLVQDKDLVVVQTEFCLYKLLRFWVFLKLHPHWTWDADPDKLQVDEFFHNRPEPSPFLLSPEGQQYLSVFRGLHLASLISQEQDLQLLTQDRILPESWLFPVLSQQWAHLLRVDSGQDRGPNDDRVSMEIFFSNCVRCGRELESKESNMWKWKVFNFGLDLVWSTLNDVLTVCRASDDNTLKDPRARLVMLRVTVSTLDKQRQTQLTQTSGVISILLVRNIEARVIDLCPEFEYPLIVSVNILSVTPQSQ